MINKISVIGSGLMGSGIAQVTVTAGYQTIILDSNQKQLTKAEESINFSLGKLVEKDKLTKQHKESALTKLSFATEIDELKDSDLIIEAISESLSAKSGLYKQLASICREDTILASNTSSLSITKLAAVSPKAENFIGIHFFNPAQLMPLVEIIPALQTSEQTISTTKGFVTSLGKSAILAKDTPGFIVNRILCPMINEAIALLSEGNSPEDIDMAIKLGANHPMGPLTLADFVGLDTLLAILEIYQAEFGEDKYRPHPLLRQYVAAGWYGKKSGRGFYQY